MNTLERSETISNLKKVELHCHLLGVIHPSLLNQLKSQDYILVDLDKLNKAYPVIGKEGFQRWLDITVPYQSASINIILALLEIHINNLINQNVVYAEIMISPIIFPEQLDKMTLAFDLFRKKVDLLEKGKIQIEFIMVIPRTLPNEKIQKDVHDFIHLYKLEYIIGVALVGIEDNQSIRRFYSYFARLKDNGLGIEIHAGEHSGPRSVWDALNYGCVDRIGHGIGAFLDSLLISKLLKSNIHLEFCITSNLKTRSINNVDQHPILEAKRLGMNYSINTDDPGVFECSMTEEFLILSDSLGFTVDDFESVFHNSLSSCFSKNLRYLQKP